MLLVVVCGAVVRGLAQGTSSARVIDEAAEALGGKNRILATCTLTITGHGQFRHQNGGGNIDASPIAPQRLINSGGSVRNIDLERGRMHLVQTETRDFVFVYERDGRGVRTDQPLDGDVAYTIGANGPQRVGDAAVRARRLDVLNNPISLVRAALDPAATLANVRRIRNS